MPETKTKSNKEKSKILSKKLPNSQNNHKNSNPPYNNQNKNTSRTNNSYKVNINKR